MRIALLGAPGSGKGTQIARLIEHFKVPQIHLSETLREISKEDTPLGMEVRDFMEAGRLLGDELMLSVIMERLRRDDAAKGFILNGFPRSLIQAEMLDKLLAKRDAPLQAALMLELDDDSLLERVLGRRTCRNCGATYNIYTAPPHFDESCDECGGSLHRRADDRESAVDSRLRIYSAQAEQIANYYQQQGKLQRIDADGDADAVFERIGQQLQRALALSKSLKKATAEQKKSAAKTPSAKRGGRKAPARPATPPAGAAGKRATTSKSPARKVTGKKAAPKRKAASTKKSVG